MDADELLAFLDESEASLRQADLGFVRLEANPTDRETIHEILRAIHSVKTNSAFFGLSAIKRLAHQMEDLLALVRSRQVFADTTAISSLLAGLDLLVRMLQHVRQGEPELPDGGAAELEQVVARLGSATRPGAPPRSWQAVWSQLTELERHGGAEVAASIGRLRATLTALAPSDALSGDAAAALAEVEQILEPSFDDLLPSAVGERVRALLESARLTLPEAPRAVAAHALVELDAMLAAVGFVPLLRETLLERLAEIRSLGAPLDVSAQSEAADVAPEPPRTTGATGRDRADLHRTMRVEETKIDQFLDYVGELIITREMFGNVGKRLNTLERQNSLYTEFQRAMGAFTALSHNLQRSIMEVRKLPVKLVLQKVPRLVRDIADQAGKQAAVTLVGDDICVDKSLLETFESPLMHMVRNAVDHGLEPPEGRHAANKPSAGNVEVVVSETSAEIVFAVRDDGRGIDVDALRERAVGLGLLSERAAAQLTRPEAFELVFAAGLSTAERVTEVSGRGVGMDVVKRNVAELGGRISIESEPGVGSTFTLHLPKAVTLQILDGFLVQVGSERLVLPLRAISESFRPTLEQLHTVGERGECVSRRGRVFPLVRVNRLLSLGARDRCPSEAIVVSVEVAGGRPAGLLVDEVLGVQQVVLREVPGIDTHAQVFAGGAVLGDGRVAMVVDVEKLGALAARTAQAPAFGGS